MEVHVLATEEEVFLVPEGNRFAITALRKMQFWIFTLRGARGAQRGVLVPLLELLRHDALVHDTAIVELRGASLVFGHLLAGGKCREGCKGEKTLHGGVKIVPRTVDEERSLETARQDGQRR